MRKGQAAMEFLMTYGWAILVVLIAIGALAYFGVLNPARFLPNSCTLFPGLACTEFVVDEDSDGAGAGTAGHVILYVRNGIGDTISITAGSLTTGSCSAAPEVGGPDPAGASIGDIGDGTLTHLNWTGCTAEGSAGSRFKADVSLTYTIGQGGLSHTRTGALVAQVEP